MKLHFAQRVMVKLVPKTSTDGSMSQNKSIVQSEVNKRRLELNKDVFKKSQEDREALKLAKSVFKHYPSAKVKEEILRAFIDSSIPNWNLSFVLTK
jgi:ABC-type metal ion transport system substrate-binding protein